jgi:hypothetical protein
VRLLLRSTSHSSQTGEALKEYEIDEELERQTMRDRPMMVGSDSILRLTSDGNGLASRWATACCRASQQIAHDCICGITSVDLLHVHIPMCYWRARTQTQVPVTG